MKLFYWPFILYIASRFLANNCQENGNVPDENSSPILNLFPAESDEPNKNVSQSDAIPKPAPLSFQAGTVWPLPQKIHYGSQNRTVRQGSIVMLFRGQGTSDCDILEHAKHTYVNKWMLSALSAKDSISDVSRSGSIRVTINMRKNCPHKNHYPPSEMNEEYRLNVPYTGDVVLEADEIWGILRGLETFSQLHFQQNGTILVRTATIHDWPEYPIRGILIDTSRHYLHKNLILREIDLLAMNKMNVLHWHIVDMESFPYVSQRFPNISKMGAFTPNHVYTPADVQEILQHARLRGIRVIPEFDSPGHMASWRGADIMSTCRDVKGDLVPSSMLDPCKEATYTFMKEFLREVLNTFQDKYLHLGGDETAYWTSQCWANNPEIKKFMQEKRLPNITELENYYINRLQVIVKELFAEQSTGRKMIFWQEVFDNNKPDPSDTIVHNWYSRTTEERYRDTKRAVEKGFQVLVSSCWYLNYINYGPDWRAGTGVTREIYYCDPRGFEGTYEQKQLVLGGIATMWGEYIDSTNVEDTLWPRTSAVAERLWSPPEQTRVAEVAWPRLQEHRCRMVARGYRAQPVNGPDYCLTEYKEPAIFK